MTSQLEVIPRALQYEDHRIRTFDIEGQRAAVAADICQALGIKNSRDAVAKLDDSDKATLRRSDTSGSTDSIWQQMPPHTGGRLMHGTKLTQAEAPR